MGNFAERTGYASGQAVGQYVMSRDEVQKAIKAVTNAANWVANLSPMAADVLTKANKVLTPMAEVADTYDGKGGLIRGLVEAVKWAMRPEDKQPEAGT